jgi:hypothetical protein
MGGSANQRIQQLTPPKPKKILPLTAILCHFSGEAVIAGI